MLLGDAMRRKAYFELSDHQKFIEASLLSARCIFVLLGNRIQACMTCSLKLALLLVCL